MAGRNTQRGGGYMQVYRSDYLTPQEVGVIFHVNAKTVSRWAKDGKLPYMRTLGGHRR